MIANDYSKVQKKESGGEANAVFIRNMHLLATMYNKQAAGVLPKILIKEYLKMFEDVESSFTGFNLKQFLVALKLNDHRS